MPVPSVVRKAIAADIPEIWRLFLMGYRENGLFEMDAAKVDNYIMRALHPDQITMTDGGPRGQIAVIGPPGKLEAVVFVILGCFWYSNDIHLEELLVYVDPECRSSEHAKSCIEWMKKTADDLDIKLVTGILSTERTGAKLRLYDRYLPRAGGFYVYPIGGTDIKKKNHNMEKEAWQDAQRKAS